MLPKLWDLCLELIHVGGAILHRDVSAEQTERICRLVAFSLLYATRLRKEIFPHPSLMRTGPGSSNK